MKWMLRRKWLSLSALLMLIMLSGRATSRGVVVGTSPCPMPTESAQNWWVDTDRAGEKAEGELAFAFWVGRIVSYCEGVEARLDG